MNQNQDIRTLLEQAQAGDGRAFRKMYEQTYDRNYYLIYAILNHEQDTLDVLQDTYVKIYQNLDQFQGKEFRSFLSWSGKVALRTTLDFMRKKNVMLFLEQDDFESDYLKIPDDKPENQPESVLNQKEIRVQVQEMLGILSEEQRICVVMYYLQEMRIKEIADSVGCPENTIKSRLRYARKKMQEYIRCHLEKF